MMNKPKLGIKKLSPLAVIPQYQTKGAAGFDIHSVEEGIIEPRGYKLIKSGIAMEIPEGYEIQIRSRSGLAAKSAIQSHFGTIDNDYKGEIGIILFNHSDETLVYNVGDRLAQAILAPVIQAEIEEVFELSDSERGDSGFGSTGTK